MREAVEEIRRPRLEYQLHLLHAAVTTVVIYEEDIEAQCIGEGRSHNMLCEGTVHGEKEAVVGDRVPGEHQGLPTRTSTDSRTVGPCARFIATSLLIVV